jgi:putative sugar O-methyltransferase
MTSNRQNSSWDTSVETAKNQVSYKNYLLVRKYVVAMLSEAHGGTDIPSRYWEEELAGFDYLLDASPLITQKIREHSYHITGLKSYEYRRHHAHKAGPFRQKLNALRCIDKNNRFVSESPELGGFGHEIDGQLVNIDTLKFYESLIALDQGGVLAAMESAKERPVIVEIGAGWGGFAYQFKKTIPNSTYVIVDLPQTILFSGLYIKCLFPEAKVFIYGQDGHVSPSAPLTEYDFVFIPHYAIKDFKPFRLDLGINMISFQEMTTEQVHGYAKWFHDNGCKVLYSHNRARSAHNDQLTNVSHILSQDFNLKEVGVLPVPYTVMQLPKTTRWSSDPETLAGQISAHMIMQAQSAKSRHLDYRHLIGKPNAVFKESKKLNQTPILKTVTAADLGDEDLLQRNIEHKESAGLNPVPILTIVMVAGPGDEALLQRNIEHIARNNFCANYVIHLLDNGCFHGYAPLSIDSKLVFIHPGEPLDLSKPNACRGSYQHAAALNRFIREQDFKTRYLLILDPDFFILRENWITEVCKHIETKKLWFFGATWHPKWFSKYRYFPSVHCMLIDTHNVKCQELDFTPDLIERGAIEDKKRQVPPVMKDAANSHDAVSVVSREWFPDFKVRTRMALRLIRYDYVDSMQPMPLSFRLVLRLNKVTERIERKWGSLLRLVRVMIRFSKVMTVNRKIINSSKDTGYLINDSFTSNSETLVPSVDLFNDFGKDHYLATKIGGFIEKNTPERWSYIPKRPGYFTENRFSQHGLPNASELDWEEFFWLDAPFGFHMRRYNKVERDFVHEDLMLQALLAPR